MHRVHHSVVPAETNSNFGFNLPWWDRLLGTYRAQPKAGHEGMTIGIEQFRTRRDLWLDRMLIQPVRGPASGYPINLENDDSEKGGSSMNLQPHARHLGPMESRAASRQIQFAFEPMRKEHGHDDVQIKIADFGDCWLVAGTGRGLGATAIRAELV